jgi:RNA polymerase sigma-70 factor (ECF subfamily)
VSDGAREEISAVLVGRAQLGDRAALEAILTAVRAPLFAHIRGILGDRDIAEDVLQDTLLTICRKLGTVREPQWFRAWAYRVATREAVRRGRRERFWMNAERDEALELVVAVDPDEGFKPELLDMLRKELPKLSAASQLVLRMHYLDELTYVEIARRR